MVYYGTFLVDEAGARGGTREVGIQCSYKKQYLKKV